MCGCLTQREERGREEEEADVERGSYHRIFNICVVLYHSRELSICTDALTHAHAYTPTDACTHTHMHAGTHIWEILFIGYTIKWCPSSMHSYDFCQYVCYTHTCGICTNLCNVVEFTCMRARLRDLQVIPQLLYHPLPLHQRRPRACLAPPPPSHSPPHAHRPRDAPL